MSTISDFEAARQQAESIRLFLERMRVAELVCEQAIKAQQFLDDWERTRQMIAEEQGVLQATRNELEADIAELRQHKQEMRDAILTEGTAALHARQAELQDGLATLEQERLHAANAYELEIKERTANIADLIAEEERLARLCHKHRTQLGRVKAEVLRVLQDEEENG